MTTINTHDIVNLSIEYSVWFAHRHPHLANYAQSLSLDGWTVRRDFRQRFFTLHRDGVVLESVPRHLIMEANHER